MKKTNKFIEKSVFKVNLKYTQMQNKTKELFFNYLNNGRPYEEFKNKLEALWGTLDHDFLQNELLEYAELIHEQNMQGRKSEREIDTSGLFTIPVATILLMENRFKKVKEREYKTSLNSAAYKRDKEEYLKLKVGKYTNQVVPYYNRETNNIQRYVQLSSYNAMVHNTNLTRAGWNTTINDAEELGYKYYVIPYHPFSCEHCISHQNRVYTIDEVMLMIGFDPEGDYSGDILHPNCKCELIAMKDLNDISQLESPFQYDFTTEEKIQFSNIRQKVNGLTLKKEEILTDIKIQKGLGNQDEVDKLNQQRNKINSSIRDLTSALPTAELRKQVVAINR